MSGKGKTKMETGDIWRHAKNSWSRAFFVKSVLSVLIIIRFTIVWLKYGLSGV